MSIIAFRSASVSRGSTPEGDGGLKRTSSSPSVVVSLPGPPAPLPPPVRTPKQLEPTSFETDKVPKEVRTYPNEIEVKTLEKKIEKGKRIDFLNGLNLPNKLLFVSITIKNKDISR